MITVKQSCNVYAFRQDSLIIVIHVVYLKLCPQCISRMQMGNKGSNKGEISEWRNEIGEETGEVDGKDEEVMRMGGEAGDPQGLQLADQCRGRI